LGAADFALPVFILALCFAEAASHFSEPGGAYLYSRTAFGDFIGFETGLDELARARDVAGIALQRICRLVGTILSAAGLRDLRSTLIIGSLLILGIIHYIGVKYGAVSIYVLTFGKVVPLVGFIILALILFPHNPIPASMHLPGRGTDWGGAALFMLFAYAGFENLGVPAGEYKNPRRDLPKALLIGLLIIGAIYVLAQLGAMAALTNLADSKTPIADAAAALVGTWGAVVIHARRRDVDGRNELRDRARRLPHALCALARSADGADQLRASEVSDAHGRDRRTTLSSQPSWRSSARSRTWRCFQRARV